MTARVSMILMHYTVLLINSVEIIELVSPRKKKEDNQESKQLNALDQNDMTMHLMQLLLQ